MPAARIVRRFTQKSMNAILCSAHAPPPLPISPHESAKRSSRGRFSSEVLSYCGPSSTTIDVTMSPIAFVATLRTPYCRM